jgi:flagellar basal body-associated protein FliL
MDAHDAQLRDMAQSALATKTIADLEKPTARNMIRNELIAGFNNILGDGAVEEIYFPEFAIQ